MDTASEGKRLIVEMEHSLQKLVSQAAARGEYSVVVQLATWAKAVRDLANIDAPGSPEVATSVHTTEEPKSSKAKSRRQKYPQFFRDSNSLIKVAWSKTTKAEYEHKAPKAVVQRLATALRTEADRKELILMDQVLPLKAADGDEIPSYQSYLCLAWMREQGLVRQHGRRGYSLKRSTNIESEVVKAWEALPTRSRT